MNIVREKIIYGNKNANRNDFHIVFGIEMIYLTNLRMLFHWKLQIILKEIFYLVVEYLQLEKVKI